jgi:hypothetical protein
MSFEEALERISRDESFKATVYAMNTLLIPQGNLYPTGIPGPLCRMGAKRRHKKAMQRRFSREF